jgi:hypothetical protein
MLITAAKSAIFNHEGKNNKKDNTTRRSQVEKLAKDIFFCK